MQRFGSMVVMLGAVALVGAFIPGVTFFALILALVGLALGIVCLVIDRSFNVLGLVGTLVSSAAVSLAIIMGIVYGS
jgi:hypothetical protein